MLDDERDPLRITSMILGEFTMCEGVIDDIVAVYMRPIAPAIRTKMGVRLSGDEPVAFLKAVVEWEEIKTLEHLPAAYRRATGVRNDLAHSTGQPDDDHRTSKWHLLPRSFHNGRKLQVLKSPVDGAILWEELQLIRKLMWDLFEVLSHLGALYFGEGKGKPDRVGPGPKPWPPARATATED